MTDSKHTTTLTEIETKNRFPRHDLTGQRFGRWTVIGLAEYRVKSYAYWHCVCDCGTLRAVRGKSLTGDETRSCGCYRIERIREVKIIHGKRRTATYNCWAKMLGRCLNQDNTGYYRYGGRGIIVCERWKTFINFYADMGDKPHGMTINRLNNEGNYEKNNCAWATPAEQANNRRTNHLLTSDGKTQTMAMWEKENGWRRHTLSKRILQGWTVERALTTPVRGWQRQSSI